MKEVQTTEIKPTMFLPNSSEEQITIKIIKSQIASVLLKYLAVPTEKTQAYPTKSPEIKPISHEAPYLHMLKLEDASENSAKGVGQVFELLMEQTGLNPEEFFA